MFSLKNPGLEVWIVPNLTGEITYSRFVLRVSLEGWLERSKITFLSQNWLGKVDNDITVPELAWIDDYTTATEPATNSMEALGNRHDCARTGLGRSKMTLLSQNPLFTISKGAILWERRSCLTTSIISMESIEMVLPTSCLPE